MVEVYDLDVWFHLAIGRDILEQRTVPRVDRYAVAALGRAYHDSHWLFQAGLAGAHRLGGMAGVQLVALSAWALALAAAYRAARRFVPSSAAAMLVFVSAMASAERFLPRPEVVTFAALTVMYLCFQEGRTRTLAELGLLAAVQAAWTNAHGLFVLGPFLAAAYGFDGAWRHRREPRAVAAALVPLAVILVATLASPYGLGPWRYALLLAMEVGPRAPETLRSLGELSPTFGAAARAAPAFWFYAVLLALLTLFAPLALARGRASPARGLVVAGLAAVSFTGRRNVALLAVVAAPFLAECLASVASGVGRALRPAAPLAAIAMLAWAAFPLSGRYYLQMEIPARFGWGATPSFFPHGLPRFLEQAQFRGQVFNSNTLGGFTLFHGFPGRLPLTDGRWEVYAPTDLEAIRRAPADPVAWQGLVRGYGIRGLALQHASPEARALLPSLPLDPRWRLVYWDHAASFWMRADVPRLPPPAAATLPPPPARVDDCFMLDLFLRDVQAPALRAQNLERALAFGWREDVLLERLGLVQVELARHGEAEASFRRLLSLVPDHSVALNELAFLAYRRGDLSAAELLLRRALAARPGDAELRANYERLREAMEGKQTAR